MQSASCTDNTEGRGRAWWAFSVTSVSYTIGTCLHVTLINVYLRLLTVIVSNEDNSFRVLSWCKQRGSSARIHKEPEVLGVFRNDVIKYNERNWYCLVLRLKE